MLHSIFKRILDVRAAAMLSGINPNVLKLPSKDLAELSDALSYFENDPFLGYSPWGNRLYGMEFRHDKSVTEMTAVQE